MARLNQNKAFRVLTAALLVLSVLSILAAGLIGLLRSPYWDRLLTRLLPPVLESLLAGSGLGLSWEALSGPMPERLHLSGLKLTDSQGVWLEADSLTLALRPGPLLHASIQARAADASGVRWHRLPVTEDPEEEAGGPLTLLPLPFSLKLEQVTIEDAVLDSGLVGLEPDGPGLEFELEGNLEMGWSTARAEMVARWRGQNTGTSLEAAFADNVLTLRADGAARPFLVWLAPYLTGLRLDVYPDLDVDLILDSRFHLPSMSPSRDSPLAVTIDGILSWPVDGVTSLPVNGKLLWNGELFQVESMTLSLASRGRPDAEPENLLTLTGDLELDREFTASARLVTPDAARAVGTLHSAVLPFLVDGLAQDIRSVMDFLPEGALDVAAEVQADRTFDRVNVRAAGNLEQGAWPWPLAQSLLGPASEADLELRRLAGDPAWEVRTISLAGETLRLWASGVFNPVDMRLRADGEAALNDVAFLLPPDAGPRPVVSGPLQVRATVEGSLAEQGQLAVALSGSTARLLVAQGSARERIRQVDGLHLDGQATIGPATAGPAPASRGRQFRAQARLVADSVEGEPVTADFRGDGTLEDMRLLFTADLFGLDADGDVRVRRPEHGVLLDGQTRIVVNSWGFAQGLGVPLDADKAEVRLLAASREGLQTVVLDLAATNLHLTGIESEFSSLSGRVRISDVFGHPVTEGRVSLGPGFVGAAPDGQRPALSWDEGELAAQAGERGAVGFGLDIRGQFQASGAGTYVPEEAALRLERARMYDSTHDVGLALAGPGVIRFEPLAVDGLAFTVHPQGSARLSALVDDSTAAVEIAINDVPLNLGRTFSPAFPDGIVQGGLTLQGSRSRPEGRMDLELHDVVLSGGGKLPGILRVRADLAPVPGAHSLLNLTAELDGLGSETAALTLRMPCNLAADAVFAETPLEGRLDWKGEVEPLWNLAPYPSTRLRGPALIHAEAAGTLGRPEFSGEAYLAGGRFEDLVNGFLFTDIDLEARYTRKGGSSVRLRASDGQHGLLGLAGDLQPTSGGPTLRLNGAFDAMKPFQRDDLDLSLSGELTITGPLTDPLIEGQAIINQGEYLILGSLGDSVPTLEPILDAADPLREESETRRDGPGKLNVRINADNRVFIRGRGLTSEWKAEVTLTGPLNDPAPVGDLIPIRGTLVLLGRNFRFNDGVVRYTGTTNPNLDLSLTYEGPQVTAIARVSGSAEHPQLLLTSDPPLPQDEIIAQVLFGKNFSELSRLETLQAANAARELAGLLSDRGLGSLGVVDNLRESLGLDQLSVGSATTGRTDRRAGRDASVQSRPGEADASVTTLEAGKYVSDRVYVGVEQGAAADSTGVRVEIDLRPNVSVDARTASESTSVGLNWKKDY